MRSFLSYVRDAYHFDPKNRTEANLLIQICFVVCDVLIVAINFAVMTRFFFGDQYVWGAIAALWTILMAVVLCGALFQLIRDTKTFMRSE